MVRVHCNIISKTSFPPLFLLLVFSLYSFSSFIEVKLTNKNCIYLIICSKTWFDTRIHYEMIATVKLINTSITHIVTFCVCGAKKFELPEAESRMAGFFPLFHLILVINQLSIRFIYILKNNNSSSMKLNFLLKIKPK